MPSDDEQAILDETAAFAEVWNQGDAKALAAFFAEDGARVGAFGDRQRGRQALEAAYERLLRQGMPGASIHQERGEVRLLSPELAVWQAGIEIVTPGSARPLTGHVMQVMKKTAGRWLILEAHPKFFPPPP